MSKDVDALFIIKTLVSVQDKETIGHSNRVAKYCYYFGKHLDLSLHDLRLITLAGYLHDIGKVSLDEDLLSKKGITPEEKQVITQHSIESANIVSSVLGLNEVANVILAHHERWDGKGYPLGLHSTQIPYLSRMLTIVDCYDALASRRRYKDPLPQTEVVKIMLDSSGQYDPILLDKFLELVDTIKTESVKTSLLTLLNVEEKRRQMHE